MKLYFYFVCLLLANHVSNVLLKSIDVAETGALPPAENKTIIDEGGLDPSLQKVDPPVFNLGPQLVTEVKDDQTNEDSASVPENAGKPEDSREGENDDEYDDEDTDDGHVDLKTEGDRIMTGNGNEDWSKEDQTQTEAPSVPTDDEEVEDIDDEGYDDGDDDDTEIQNDAPVDDNAENTETGENNDEVKNDADDEDDDSDENTAFDASEYEDDHFQEYNPDDYDQYEEDYNYDDEYTKDQADSSKYDIQTTTSSYWDEHKDSSNKEDDYDYDDAGEKEGYTGDDKHENIPTGVNTWDLLDGESKVTTTPITESYWDDYSDEDDSVEINFDDYFGEIKTKPGDGTKLEDSSKTDDGTDTLVDTSVDAGKDMMESGHHFDNNIGMFAGTKVSNNNVKNHAFEVNKSTVYAWTLFVTLFLVLLVLFIVWNRKTVSRYIVSLRGSRQTSGPGLTQRKQEDQKNLLNHEFA